MFKFLDKVLGAIVLTLLVTPIIALAALSKLFNFIDLLYQGKIGKAFFSLIFSPLTAMMTALTGASLLLEQGWNNGLMALMLTFPERSMYFFKKQLFWGTQEDEYINDIFVSPLMPLGLEEFITSGFFGKVTLKLLSLCLSMEIYLSYDAKTVSPHNDVSLYFTEKNLNLLKKKYEQIEQKESAEISCEIKQYLSSRYEHANSDYEEVNRLTSDDDGKAGRLQSAKDKLDTIRAAKRCIEYFSINRSKAPDLGRQFQCTPTTVLNYVWLAIKHECTNENQDVLKENLIWTLFLIQRGFNITNGGSGEDIPECLTGTIGLLVRVICDERIPDSGYEAQDPTPANLTLALQTALNRPFTSSYGVIAKVAEINYLKDSKSYKNKQKKEIMNQWKVTFKPLLKAGALEEETMKSIIDTGVDAWEPPIQNTISF